MPAHSKFEAPKKPKKTAAQKAEKAARRAQIWAREYFMYGFESVERALSIQYKHGLKNLAIPNDARGFVEVKDDLFTLLHARQCHMLTFDKPCWFGTGRCMTFKDILLHLSHCYLGQECPGKDTVRIQELIFHWLYCSLDECELCSPFKGTNRKIFKSQNLKMITLSPVNSTIECTAKCLHFGLQNFDITLVIDLFGLDCLSNFCVTTEEFEFREMKWKARVLNLPEVEMRGMVNSRKTLAVGITVCEPELSPFWHMDCICDIKVGSLFITRSQNRFRRNFNCEYAFFDWEDVVICAEKGRISCEISLSSVTFAEVCPKVPKDMVKDY